MMIGHGWICMKQYNEEYKNNKRKPVRYILISGLIATIMIIAMSNTVLAADYYVSTSGNNNNPGTLESPWRNIDYGADNIEPGDTVWITSGTYYNDFITISSSGTANNPKNIRKYDGTVLIDGKDATGTGISMNGMSYWNIQGIDIKNIKCPVYWSGQNTHHINLSDCEISYFINSITVNKGTHDITLYNVKIHTLYSGSGNHLNIFGGKDDNSLVTRDIKIINCEIYNNNKHNGINFGPATGGGNSDWYGEYVIDGVLIENTKVHGIQQQAVVCNYVTVNNLQFINNTVYDSTKGVRLTLIDSVLRGNEIYGIRDGNPMALQFENGKSRNVLFDRNYIHDSPGSKGYHAIEIRKVFNVTVSDLKQSGMKGYVKSYEGSSSERILKDICEDKYTFGLTSGPAGATIEYSKGDVFKVSGSGTITGPEYYPAKSSATVSTSSSNDFTVTHYDMTVEPQDTLTSVKVNKFDSSADIYDWTVTSSKVENPVWFNVAVQSANSNYEVQRDGKYITSVSSDSNKKIKFYYNEDGSEWESSHTFRIIKLIGPGPTPTPDPTSTPTPDPTSTPTPDPTSTPTPDPTSTPTPTETPISPKDSYDNRLREVSPNTILDKTTWIDAGKIEDSDYNSVIWFDLSQYNSTDTIETATISLLWYYEARDHDTEVGIYRSAEWDPQYVTWDSCTDNVDWNNPGGDWFDKNNAAQGTQPYDTVSFSYGNGPDNQYHDFDITELVQAYVDGTYTNNGFFIKADDVNNGYIAFYSLDCPNSDQQPKLTITLKEDVEEPPVLNPIGTKSVDINSLLQFTITATDPNGDALTYSATGLPTGAGFDPSTATFSWTLGEGQEGSYQVLFKVTDGSLVDSEEITIKVNKNDALVVLNGIDNRMREVAPNTVIGATTWIDVGKIRTDNYNGLLMFDLSQFKSTDHIESATLSLLWYYESREQNTEVGIYRPVKWSPDYVTWNTRTNGVQWNNPGGDWYDKNNAAQGAEAYDTIVFSKDAAPDGQYHNFDVTQLVQSYVDGTYENTGLLIKADKENDGYVAFYSSDWSDADQRPKVTITYKPGEEPVNQAPVLDPIGNKTVETGNMVEFEITASDPNSDALIYSATGLPGGANFNTESHIFSWTPDKGQAGSYHVHFEVTDGSLVDTEDVTITVSVSYPSYDINKDGIVDILDITIIVENYGTTTVEPYPRCDVNTDGIVNIEDLDCVASHFGEISI